MCKLKVPHKAKKYDQMFFRTMWFPREEAVTIDGVKYEIPNHIRVDTWNSKLLIVTELFEVIKAVDEMEKDDYLETKKKLISKLKDFDKQYMKHIKKTHPEVHDIVMNAITPLLNLLESNYNFHKLEELKKTNNEIPSFRYNALEDRFCEHLEVICKVLADHGKLEDIYDIKRMLNLLKLDDWEDNVPMAFYLTPLKVSIKLMRDELLHMRKLGANRCKYYIEENQPMHELIIKMVKNDVTAQWLMGDSIKNDQLCFMYNVIRIIFMSPLKNKLINKDKDLIDSVIPKLACFKALLVIRDILNIKNEEDMKVKKIKNDEDRKIREAKKAKKAAGLPITSADEKKEEKKVEEEPVVYDETEEERDARLLREQKKYDEDEMKNYGRKWIWQNYISENRKQDWENAAKALRHINEHVIQDIQDYILIQGFPKQKQANRKAIKEEVETLMIASNKIKNKDSKEEIEEAKSKRNFELSLRPPFVWNFQETRLDQEQKIKLEIKYDKNEGDNDETETTGDEEPYLINENAAPETCYKFEEAINTNRVSKFLKDLESLTYNLRSHEETKWKTLVELCIEIFRK